MMTVDHPSPAPVTTCGHHGPYRGFQSLGLSLSRPTPPYSLPCGLFLVRFDAIVSRHPSERVLFGLVGLSGFWTLLTPMSTLLRTVFPEGPVPFSR